MLVCALVSQPVKYEALGFSVTCGKLNVCARASFEILEKEILYSLSHYWYIVKHFLQRKTWMQQTETEL